MNPQRCFKVELRPGVFEGINATEVPEDNARLYRTKAAAAQSTAVKFRKGTPVEYVLIRESRVRDLEFCERRLASLEEHGVGDWAGYSYAIACAEGDCELHCDLSEDEGDDDQ